MASFNQSFDCREVGAPSRASAAVGRQVMGKCSQVLAAVALRVLDGFDYRKLPRFYDTLDPRDAIGDQAERRHDNETATKEEQWLKSKGLESGSQIRSAEFG